jgi:origin recognition complex subunit 5
VTKAVLESLNVPHVIVSSRECITARHLLEQTIVACRRTVQKLGHELASMNLRCENVNAFENQLEKSLANVPKFVIVFDGIDRQKESGPGLITGLSRLGYIVRVSC